MHGNPAIIGDPAEAEAKLTEFAGAKYSYRQLDDFTDLIQRTLQGVPEVSTVTRSGVLPEQIYLDYSQQRLAQYGYDPSKLKDVLNAQNITLPGRLRSKSARKNININPSGLFPDAHAIGNVIIGVSAPTARSTCATWSISRVPIRARQRSELLTWQDAGKATGFAAAPSRWASTCAPASRSNCSASTCTRSSDSVKHLPARRSGDRAAPPTSRSRSKRTSTCSWTRSMRRSCWWS